MKAVMATLTITAVAACGTDADQAPAAVDAPVEGVRVTLVDAGEAPKQPLVWFTAPEEQQVEYAYTRGLEQHTEVDQAKKRRLEAEASSSAAASSADASSAEPSSSESADASASESASNTDAAESGSNSDSELNKDDFTVPYSEVTMMLPLTANIQTDGDVRTSTVTVGTPTGDNTERNEDIASAEGFRMTSKQDSSGRTQTRSFSAPEGATDSARASVEEALVQMNNLPLVFPSEPLGQGAKWTVSNRVDDGGMSLLQDVTYTVTSKQNKTVTLAVSVDRRPATQFLAGTDLKILDVSTESSGQITVDLTHPLPQRGSVNLTTTTRYGKDDSATEVVQKSTSKSTWS
ncbi:hypothetical protein [Corynebacterium dentalis]|uniref:hypothetical protein n=1 Tax=Corynebacterium dentalis TaxID=2014528 RepID=UPI00289FEA61|nr:hypothetical protein [Corynebacterium dentalis]